MLNLLWYEFNVGTKDMEYFCNFYSTHITRKKTYTKYLNMWCAYYRIAQTTTHLKTIRIKENVSQMYIKHLKKSFMLDRGLKANCDKIDIYFCWTIQYCPRKNCIDIYANDGELYSPWMPQHLHMTLCDWKVAQASLSVTFLIKLISDSLMLNHAKSVMY